MRRYGSEQTGGKETEKKRNGRSRRDNYETTVREVYGCQMDSGKSRQIMKERRERRKSKLKEKDTRKILIGK